MAFRYSCNARPFVEESFPRRCLYVLMAPSLCAKNSLINQNDEVFDFFYYLWLGLIVVHQSGWPFSSGRTSFKGVVTVFCVQVWRLTHIFILCRLRYWFQVSEILTSCCRTLEWDWNLLWRELFWQRGDWPPGLELTDFSSYWSKLWIIYILNAWDLPLLVF